MMLFFWVLVLHRLVSTVKVVISSTSETKGLLEIVTFQISERYTNVYLSVLSNLIHRLNHLTCHLIPCPVFPVTLSLPFLLLLNMMYIFKNQQYTNTTNSQHCITYTFWCNHLDCLPIGFLENMWMSACLVYSFHFCWKVEHKICNCNTSWAK